MSTCRSENVKAKLELVQAAIEEIRQEFNKCECMGNCAEPASRVERNASKRIYIMTNKGPMDLEDIAALICDRPGC